MRESHSTRTKRDYLGIPTNQPQRGSSLLPPPTASSTSLSYQDSRGFDLAQLYSSSSSSKRVGLQSHQAITPNSYLPQSQQSSNNANNPNIHSTNQISATNYDEYPKESLDLISDFITDRHGIRKKAQLGELKVQKRRTPPKMQSERRIIDNDRLRRTMRDNVILSSSLNMYSALQDSVEISSTRHIDSLPHIILPNQSSQHQKSDRQTESRLPNRQGHHETTSIDLKMPSSIPPKTNKLSSFFDSDNNSTSSVQAIKKLINYYEPNQARSRGYHLFKSNANKNQNNALIDSKKANRTTFAQSPATLVSISEFDNNNNQSSKKSQHSQNQALQLNASMPLLKDPNLIGSANFLEETIHPSSQKNIKIIMRDELIDQSQMPNAITSINSNSQKLLSTLTKFPSNKHSQSHSQFRNTMNQFQSHLPQQQTSFSIASPSATQLNQFQNSLYTQSSASSSKKHLRVFQASTSSLFEKIKSTHHSKNDSILLNNTTNSSTYQASKYALKSRIFKEEEIIDGLEESNGRFLKIRIKNIANFKDEPLIKYDVLSIADDDLAAQIAAGRLVNGLSKWRGENGETQWKPCLVLSFDKTTQLYKIQWSNEKNKVKDVTRLNLIIERENLNEYEDRVTEAGKRRTQKLYTDSLNERITNDVDFSDILISKSTFYSILNKSLAPFDDSLRQLYCDQIMQLIIQEYKYGILQFVLCIRTVQSVEEYFEKYLPHLELSVQLKVNRSFVVQSTRLFFEEHEVITSPESLEEPENQNNFTYTLKSKEIRKDEAFNQSAIFLSRSIYNSQYIYMLESQPEALSTVSASFNKIVEVSFINIFDYFEDDSNWQSQQHQQASLLQTQNSSSITTITPLNSFDVDYFSMLSQKFKKQTEKIEMCVYHIEKEIENGIAYLSQRSIIIQEIVKTSKELPNFVELLKQYKLSTLKLLNVALKEQLRICLTQSFTHATTFFEKYYSILPLIKTSGNLLRFLPSTLISKRDQYRELLNLKLSYNPSLISNEHESVNSMYGIIGSGLEVPRIPLESTHKAEKALSQGSIWQDAEEVRSPFEFDLRMIFLVYRSITTTLLKGFSEGKSSFLASSPVIAAPLVRIKFILQPRGRRNPAIKDIIIYILLNRNKIYSLSKKLGSQTIQRLKPIEKFETFWRNKTGLTQRNQQKAKNQQNNVGHTFETMIENAQSDYIKTENMNNNKNNNSRFNSNNSSNSNSQQSSRSNSSAFSYNSFFDAPVIKSAANPAMKQFIHKSEPIRIKRIKQLLTPRNNRSANESHLADPMHDDDANFDSYAPEYEFNTPTFKKDLKFIMYDLLRLNLTETKSFESFQKKCANKDVTCKRLGWFSIDEMRIQTEPKLESIEEQLAKSLRSPVDGIISLEQIYGFLDKSGNKPSDFSSLHDEISSEFSEFKHKYNHFFRWNLYPIYSTLLLFNHFDFYLFEKDYITELIFIFEHSNQVRFLGQERQSIIQDRDFITNKIPDEIQFGLFLVDLREIKALLRQKMTKFISEIDSSLNRKMESLLQESHDRKQYILKELSLEPQTIEEYIELKEIINSKKINEAFRRCENEAAFIKQIFSVIEENFVAYQPSSFRNFLESKLQISLLVAEQKKAQQRFESSRNKFQKEFKERRDALFKSFVELSAKQKLIIKSPELKQYEENLRNCKFIEDAYKALLGKGKELNNQQSVLGYPLSDFKEIENAFNGFGRYVEFWEFTEKWFRFCENWDVMTFEEIFRTEMQNEIKNQIVSTCREGKILLDKLKALFSMDEDHYDPSFTKKNTMSVGEKDFLQLINQVDKSISTFSEYLHIFVLLIDKAFTSEFQDALMTRFLPGTSFMRISLSVMRTNRIGEHSELIYRLHGRGRLEVEVREVMQRAEVCLEKEIQPIIGMSSSPNPADLTIPALFIANGRSVMRRIKEVHLSCSCILNNSHIPASRANHANLFLGYLDLLMEGFKAILLTQDNYFNIYPFFATTCRSMEPITPESTSMITLFDAYKEEFKQQLNLIKVHFQRSSNDLEQEIQFARKKLETIQSLKEKGDQLCAYKLTFISTMRNQNPRFYFLTDSEIAELLLSSIKPEAVQKCVHACFPGAFRSIEVLTIEEMLVVSSYKNIENEEHHPSDQIRVPLRNFTPNKAIKASSHSTSSSSQPMTMTPIMQIIMQLEQYSTRAIRKNIFQNIRAVLNLNYDLVDLMKIYKKKQIGFQSLTLLLDVCFYHDLTVLLSLQEDFQIDPTEKINQQQQQQQPIPPSPNKNPQQQSQPQQQKQNPPSQQQQQQQPLKLHFYLETLRKHLMDQLKAFIHFMKERREMNTIVTKQQNRIYQKVILVVLTQIEILSSFIKTQTISLNSFAYLSLPKFSLEFQGDITDQSNFLSAQQHARSLQEEPQNHFHSQIILPVVAQQSSVFSSYRMQVNKEVVAATSEEDPWRISKTKQEIAAAMHAFHASSIPRNEARSNIMITNPAAAMYHQSNDSRMPKIAAKSEFLNRLVGKDPFLHVNSIRISLMALNFKIPYEYEMQQTSDLFITTNTSLKLTFQCLQALSTLHAPLLQSPISSGKTQIIRQLANALGKTLYEYSIEENFPYPMIVNILSGTFSGGFWVCFRHMDLIPLSTISLIASLAFLVRSALVEGRDKISFQVNMETPLLRSGAILSTFSVCNDKKGHDFAAMPNSLLEAFRTISFIKQDFIAITKTYCFLMNFKQPADIAIKFNYFISMMNEQFVTNFARRFKSNSEQDQNIIKFISYSSQLVIFERALEIIRERDNEDEDPISSLDALKASLDIFFSGVTTSEMFEIYQEVFTRFFTEKPSLLVVDLVENRKILEPLKEYFMVKEQELHDSFIKIVANVIHQVEQSRNIIISGRAGTGKSTLIEIGAFVYDRIIERSFGINVIPVDAIERQSLERLLMKIFAHSDIDITIDPQEHTRDSILQRDDILSFDSDAITQDPSIKKRHRYLSKYDWLIFDCGSLAESPTHAVAVESLLGSIETKCLRTSEEGREICMPSEMPIIVTIEDLSNVSPRFIHSFSLIALEEEIISEHDQFGLWLKSLIEKQQKFREYEPYLRASFDALFYEIANHIFKLPAQSYVHRISQKHFLYNLITLLEIFLNEMRKRDLAFGFFEQPNLSTTENSKNEAPPFLFDPLELRNAPNAAQEISMYECILHNNVFLDQRKKMITESIFVYSLCLVLQNCLQESSKSFLSQFIATAIEASKQKSTFNVFTHNLFAFNLGDLLTLSVPSINIFEYHFDLVDLRWKPLTQMENVDTIAVLSNSLLSNSLYPSELLRLNPRAAIIEEIRMKSIIENYIMNQSPPSSVSLDAPSQKQSYFLLKFLLSYNYKVMLASPKNSGKSEILKKISQHFQRQSRSCLFQMSMSEHITLPLFQKMIEAKILSKSNLESSIMKHNIIMVDDLNMSVSDKLPNPAGSVRSLILHDGWYSAQQAKFIRFQQFGFVGTTNINSKTKQHSNRNSSFGDVSESLGQKCFILTPPALSDADLISIYASKITSMFTNGSANELQAKTRQSLLDSLKRFCIASFYNAEVIEDISKKYGSTLSLSLLIQTIFQLRNFEGTTELKKPEILSAFIFALNNNCCDQFESNIFHLTPSSHLSAVIKPKQTTSLNSSLITEDAQRENSSDCSRSLEDDGEYENSDSFDEDDSDSNTVTSSFSSDSSDTSFSSDSSQSSSRKPSSRKRQTEIEENSLEENSFSDTSRFQEPVDLSVVDDEDTPGDAPLYRIRLIKPEEDVEENGQIERQLFPRTGPDGYVSSNNSILMDKADYEARGNNDKQIISEQDRALQAKWMKEIRKNSLKVKHLRDFFQVPKTIIKKLILPCFGTFMSSHSIIPLIEKRNEILYFSTSLLEFGNLKQPSEDGQNSEDSKLRLRRLTDSNYKEVETRILQILLKELDKSRWRSVCSMPTRQFIENTLKLAFNFAPGEDFSTAQLSSSFLQTQQQQQSTSSSSPQWRNIIVKHSYEDARVLTIIETALKSRVCAMLTLSNPKQINTVINAALRIALLHLNWQIVYIVIMATSMQPNELQEIQSAFAVLLSSTEFYLLLEKKLLDEILTSYLLKHEKNTLTRDHILQRVKERITRRIKLVYLQKMHDTRDLNIGFLSPITVLLPHYPITNFTSEFAQTPSTTFINITQDHLVLHAIRHARFLSDSHTDIAMQAFKVHHEITKFNLLAGERDLYGISVHSHLTKPFVVYASLKKIFNQAKQTFRKNDPQYKELAELLTQKTQVFQEKISSAEQRVSTLVQKVESHNNMRKEATERSQEILKDISDLEQSRDSTATEIKAIKSDNSVNTMLASLNETFISIQSIKETDVQTWWNNLRESLELFEIHLQLFIIIINDDEFFADKYPKLPLNASIPQEVASAIEILSKKINPKHIKQILLKSFNMFIVNLPFAAEKSISTDKLRFLSPFYSQKPQKNKSIELTESQTSEIVDPTISPTDQMISTFISQICKLHSLEESRQIALKQLNSKLDGFHAHLQFQNEELLQASTRITTLNLDITTLQQTLEEQQHSLEQLRIFNEKVLQIFANVRTQALEPLLVKSLALEPNEIEFDQQIYSIAIYLSYFACLQEDIRFSSLELITSIKKDVQYYIRRLVFASITAQPGFEFLMYRHSKHLPMTNALIYDIAWIEFILKQQDNLPYLVIKDFSGAIQEFFHKQHILIQAESGGYSATHISGGMPSRKLYVFKYFDAAGDITTYKLQQGEQEVTQYIQTIFASAMKQATTASHLSSTAPHLSHAKDDVSADAMKVLVLVNPTTNLLLAFRTLIERKYDEVLYDGILESQQQQSQQIPAPTQSNLRSYQKIQPPIKKPTPKEWPKIVVLYTSSSFMSANNAIADIMEKTLVIDCQIKSEFSWRHLHKDILVNAFEFPEKISFISKAERKIDVNQRENKRLTEEVKVGIRGIQEHNLSSMDKINLENSMETLSSLQAKQQREELNMFDFFLLEKQSKDKKFSVISPIPNARVVRESSKTNPQQAQPPQETLDDAETPVSRSNQTQNQLHQQQLQQSQASQQQQQQQQQQSQQTISTSQSQQVPYGVSNFQLYISDHIQISIAKYKEYAYLIEGLEKFSLMYDDLVGFIFVIKRTLHSLSTVIGNIYGFSDEYFRTLTFQVCDNLKKNHITSQPENIAHLLKQFSLFYIQAITSALHKDHRNLFYFYLGLDYLKATAQISELQYQLLLGGGHKTRELVDLNAFSSEHQKTNFVFLEEKMNEIFKVKESMQIPEYTVDHSFQQHSTSLPFLKYMTKKQGTLSQLPFFSATKQNPSNSLTAINDDFSPVAGFQSQSFTEITQKLSSHSSSSKQNSHSSKRTAQIERSLSGGITNKLKKQHTLLNLEAIPESQSKKKHLNPLEDENSSTTSIKIDKDELTSSHSSQSSSSSDDDDDDDNHVNNQQNTNRNKNKSKKKKKTSSKLKSSNSFSGSLKRLPSQESVSQQQQRKPKLSFVIPSSSSSKLSKPDKNQALGMNAKHFANLVLSVSQSQQRSSQGSTLSLQIPGAPSNQMISSVQPPSARLHVRASILAQSQQIIQARRDNIKRINSTLKLLLEAKQTLKDIDIPLICYRRIESIEKESYFFLLMYQMIVNQCQNREFEVFTSSKNLPTRKIGALGTLMNPRDVKFLKFSVETARRREKLKQISDQNRKPFNFFNVVEETVHAKALVHLKTNIKVQSSFLRSKIKMTQAIIKSKQKRKEQVKLLQAVKQIDELEEEQVIAEEEPTSTAALASISELPTVTTAPQPQPQQQQQLNQQPSLYEFKLPQAVTATLQHYKKIFSSDPTAAPFLKAIDIILNKNSTVQKFLYSNADVYQSKFKLFKLPPLLAQLNLNPIEIALLVKCLKPHDLELYLKDTFLQSFGIEFGMLGQENLETLCRSKHFYKPILILTSDISVSTFDIIEMKLLKTASQKPAQQSQHPTNPTIASATTTTTGTTGTMPPPPPRLHRMALHAGSLSTFEADLKIQAEQGKWVFLTGIHTLSNASCVVQVIRDLFMHINASTSDFRLFILYECESDLSYSAISLPDPASPLAYLFSISHKTFINASPSVKSTLSSYFNKEMHEHLLQVERVLIDFDSIPSEFLNDPRSNQSIFIVQPQFKRLVRSSTHVTPKFPTISLESTRFEHEKFIAQESTQRSQKSINLHSFLASTPSKQLSKKKLDEMIHSGSLRTRFNTTMIMSILHQRQTFLRQQSKQSNEVTHLNVSEIDSRAIMNDLLCCLDTFSPSPFKFISDYLSFLFDEHEHHHQQAFVASVIRLFFEDFLCYPLEKHRIIEVSGRHYPLLKSTPLTLAIQSFVNTNLKPPASPIRTSTNILSPNKLSVNGQGKLTPRSIKEKLA